MIPQEDRMKLLVELKIPHATVFLNSECLICHKTEKEMIKLGAISLCKKCFLSEFQTDDPVDKERELYLKLVKESEKAGKSEKTENPN